MAEHVQYRTEQTIPELEQLQRIGLLEKSELRAVVTRRKEFEYKIQRRTKCKEDFMQYIQFEMHLLKLIKIRRKKNRKFMKKTEIEHAITNRVDKLFDSAVRTFREDIKLWISYIKFCKDVGFTSTASRIIVNMLGIHSDKPHLWKMAADWEFDSCYSVDSARKYLQRGLHFHPSSHLLYQEAFHLELKNTCNEREKFCKDAKTSSAELLNKLEEDPILSGLLAEVVYNAAYSEFKDVKFSFDCLAIAEKYDFTKSLQEKIIDTLAQNNKDSVVFWDMLAKRAMKGLPIKSELFGSDEERLEELDVKDPNQKQKLLAGVAVYEMAVKKIPTEEMWSAYLDGLSLKPAVTVLRRELLMKAYESAHESGLMHERHYTPFIEFLKESNLKNSVLEVATAGACRHPQSVDLWLHILQYHLNAGDMDQASSVFDHVIGDLATRDDRLLPVWMALIRHYCTVDEEMAEELFTRGLGLGTEVSQQLKPVYVEWLHATKGLEPTRTKYNLLSLQPPLSLELHLKMIEIEMEQSTVDAKAVRRCYNLATHQFGSENCDLWHAFCKFEASSGEPRNTSAIYRRALAALKPALVDHFVEEFTLNKTRTSDF